MPPTQSNSTIIMMPILKDILLATDSILCASNEDNSPKNENHASFNSSQDYDSLLPFADDIKDIFLGQPQYVKCSDDSFPIPYREFSSFLSDTSDDDDQPVEKNSGWNERFQALLKFKNIYGHCLVPTLCRKNIGLSGWVKNQRYQWTRAKAGKKSNLTAKRKESLDAIGFEWDPHKWSWEKHLGPLLDFKLRHGHTNVPARYEDKSLAHWAKYQRRQFRLMCREGSRNSKLSVDRLLRLVALDFVFDPVIWRENEKRDFPQRTFDLVLGMVPPDIKIKMLKSIQNRAFYSFY